MTWIPGDADLVVVVGALAALVAGGLWWRARGRARPADTPEGTSTPGARAPSEARTDTPEAAETRMGRLRSRLGGGVGAALQAVFARGTLTESDWEELEEILLMADVGPEATDAILTGVRDRLKADGVLSARDALRAELVATVDPALDRSLALDAPGTGEAAAIVVVGVNGVGKTTTVGKIARLLVAQGHSVLLGAADTFRAAAADQLETWGSRVGVQVVRADREGADPASVAFAAADAARTEGTDVLLVDTAGRLQNKRDLMDQLGKIVRVVSKVRAPSEVLLVLDATTGQNGLAQAKVFAEATGLTGIVLTKIDGSAKGGIVIAVQRQLGVPVKFIGLGEGADDLAPFEAEQFVDGLLGE